MVCNSKPSGVFIVLEGIDGSGKTTQHKRLQKFLRGLHYKVCDTAEPTRGYWGQKYRAWAKKPNAVETKEDVLQWMINDHLQHLKDKVIPALNQNMIVLCDRYEISTLAYQVSSGIDRDFVYNAVRNSNSIKPDITFWFDADPVIALDRLATRSDDSAKEDKYENLEFLNKVRDEYSTISKMGEYNFSKINANMTEIEVSTELAFQVLEFLETSIVRPHEATLRGR